MIGGLFPKVGLTALPSLHVKAPRVKEACINIECRLSQVVSLGNKPGNGQLVLGEILAVHVNRPELLDENNAIVSGKLDAVSRLGRNDYMNFGAVFSLKHIR